MICVEILSQIKNLTISLQCVYISIHKCSHKTQQLYIISSDIYYAATCFGPVCRPSSGCLENLSYYTMRVVPFCGGGRDLALQHESWKAVTIKTHILRGYISCTYLINLAYRQSIETIILRCCINR